MTDGDDDVAWEPVRINTGYGTPGFALDNTNLQWSEKNGFGGWLGELPLPFSSYLC